MQNSFAIKQYEFQPGFLSDINNDHYAKNSWPLVYILSDGRTKQAYVGETTDVLSRMSIHLKNDRKSKLTSVHLITSGKFHKSATLDIESNLIKYISGDGQYNLLNGNLGLANHNYFQKNEVYWGIFNSIWDSLRAEGITKHSVNHIDNSDLFKYSPYKSLNREQRDGLQAILTNLLNNKIDNLLVEGGAGTGKTILAIFLFKLLSSEHEDFNFGEFELDESIFIDLVKKLKDKYRDPSMALVVPMASFRETLKKVFKNIKGLSSKMVVGPSEVVNNNYDILVVDESHRLRRRVNLGTYFGSFDKACKKLGLDKYSCSELDWILQKSKKSILFYDGGQSIKPSDTKKEDFDKLKSLKSSSIEQLKSQFRVRGGNAYVDFITRMLNGKMGADNEQYMSPDYEFLLFDSIDEMANLIKLRDKESGLSRLVAGYSWEWISKKDPEAYDIEIRSTKLRWNSVSKDWINSKSAVQEVGCIHTTQGYDLNYAGIIFGYEISYDEDKDEIIILKENYYDKNGKQSIEDPDDLKEFILNIYRTILLRGIKGTYVYVCDDKLRSYLSKYIPSANPKKQELKYLPFEEVKPFVNSIPVYDLQVAAGEFGDLQSVEDVHWIQLPEDQIPSKDLFACKVIGESMNKVIPNGTICLFRKYDGGSRNGQIVIVEFTDLQDSDSGSCYTIKEYQSKKKTGEDQWEHESIILKPLSMDGSYTDIVLSFDEGASLKVIGIFERVL